MALNKGRCAWVTSVGLALSMALVGCSASTEVDSTPTPSAPTPSVSVTPTPTPSPMPTPSTASEQAAVDGVVCVSCVWWTNSVSTRNPTCNELNTVATGQALAQMQHNLMQYRDRGLATDQVSRCPRLSAPRLDRAPTQWFITMCIDVSGVDVARRDGHSVKNPDGVHACPD